MDRKNRSDMCPRWESNPRLPACKASTLSTRPGSPLCLRVRITISIYTHTLYSSVLLPGPIAQSAGHLTSKSGVLGLIPSLATYFRFSFRFFKKGSCQVLAHEVLVNRLGGLSLPRKSMVRLTDRPDITLNVYGGRKTTMQQQQQYYCHRQLHVIPLKYGVD